jgi:hypothetical protein
MTNLLRILSFLTAITCTAIALASPDQTGSQTPQAAMITGQVQLPDRSPMANGVILLFDQAKGPPPHPHKYWRIPDSISSISSNGKFSLSLPDGIFYLMIAQKDPESDIGPPSGSEYLYIHAAADGTLRPLVMKAGVKLELGILTTQLWSADLSQRSKEITAIQGVISDLDGHPVENAVVFGYREKSARGRPLYVSDRTGKDGAFQLRVANGGTYYLRVRSVLGGGAPKTGEYLNTTDEFAPTVATLQTNQVLRDIGLKAKKFMRPTEAAGKEMRNMQKPDTSP